MAVSGIGFAAKGGNQPNPLTGVFASDIRIVGGVDKPDNFRNIDLDDPTNVLHCRELPEPDPLIALATPTTATGVDPSDRGTVDATNVNLNFSDPSGLNRIENISGTQTLILHPGIYNSISITGGNVKFVPGIFVISPKQNTTNSLKITGGIVEAEGIMFYNTANSYSPQNGTPDVNDGESKPPAPPRRSGRRHAILGGVPNQCRHEVLAHQYGDLQLRQSVSRRRSVSPEFNGMLFYQRRRNNNPMTITGDSSSSGLLAGTLYAKWANVQISGQGTYDAQFVVGSISVTGQGNVTINYSGQNLGKAPGVFLVEQPAPRGTGC